MSASPVKPAIKDSDDVLVNLKDVTRIFSSVIKTEAVKLVGRIERLEKQIQEHTQTNEELKNNLASLTLKNEESVKAMGKKETKTGDVINKNNKQQREKQVNLKRGADTEAKQSKFDSNTTNETNQQQNKKKVVRRKRRRKIAEEKKNQLVSLDPGANLIFSPGTSASEPNIWIYVGRAGAKEDVKGLQKLVSSSAAAVLKLGSKEECRYGKGAWSECDSKTNMRSRTLTLKKGNQTTCESTKTIQKKCKKACRYEKGTWGDCNAQSLMTRNDKLKPNSDASCEQNRQITKKCKPKSVKPTKATRRNRQ